MTSEKCEACRLVAEINKGTPVFGGDSRLQAQINRLPSATDLGIAFLLKQNCTCKEVKDG